MRAKTKSRLLCFAAALVLVVFVGAQALCIIHCNLGAELGKACYPSCHGSVQAADAGGEPHPPNPPGSTTCDTLKTMLGSVDTQLLAAHQPGLLYLLAAIAWDLKRSATQPETPSSRRSRARARLFTQEVCSRLANPALAPPSLS